jgi:hypothetical protein
MEGGVEVIACCIYHYLGNWAVGKREAIPNGYRNAIALNI